jgi:membrane protein implicated in regulation of membrane protease activity
MFWIWVGIAALFIVGEIFTESFFLFPFGIGAGVAALLNAVGMPSWMQWAAFVVVSGVLVLLSRRLAERFSKEPPERMGVDRLIGEMAVVIETIDPLTDAGRVRVKKDHWRATSADESKIEKDTTVRVIRVEGVHLVVERADKPAGDPAN